MIDIAVSTTEAPARPQAIRLMASSVRGTANQDKMPDKSVTRYPQVAGCPLPSADE